MGKPLDLSNAGLERTAISTRTEAATLGDLLREVRDAATQAERERILWELKSYRAAHGLPHTAGNYALTVTRIVHNRTE